MGQKIWILMPLPMYQEKSRPGPLEGVKQVIAVAAGKGGVGKSAVSVHLALALKRLGCSAGILDIDLYGPSIRKMLPEDRMPKQSGETLFPASAKGVKMLSLAYFRRDEEAAAVRAPIANSLVRQFVENVHWGELDFLLIDFPPGTGDIQLTVSQQAPLTAALMVTTPQEVALMDVRKAVHLFEQVKVPVCGVVENMSYYRNKATGDKEYLFGTGAARRFAGEAGVPYLGEIPLDPGLSASLDRGQSIFETAPEGEAAEAFIRLAEALRSRDPASVEIARAALKDPKTLVVEWSDGAAKEFSLSELQENCPCAGCTAAPPPAVPDVQGDRVIPVGRYAIRIAFNKGCSMGIYNFEALRAWND